VEQLRLVAHLFSIERSFLRQKKRLMHIAKTAESTTLLRMKLEIRLILKNSGGFIDSLS